MCCPERVKQADITAVQMALTLALHAVPRDNANFDEIFFRRVCVRANVCTCLCACVRARVHMRVQQYMAAHDGP